MTIPGSASSMLMAAAAAAPPAGGYQVERSLRFNSSDSAYLSRTPASAGNRKTWTWAGWVKRSAFGAINHVFNTGAGVSLPVDGFIFQADNTLKYRSYDGSSEVINLVTTQVFRDPSAWFHLVFAIDTTQSTSTNRVKIYVNGAQITAFSTATYGSPNYDTGVNATMEHRLGDYAGFNQFNGYLADIHFIDGQALTPAAFTEVSATTGQLVPIEYTGTYGTNGFWVSFSDNSAATAATLGADTSGNGNNWTPNNLSVFSAIKSGAGSVTAGAPFNSSFPWTTAFDGAIDTTGAVSNAAGANSFVWTFANTLTGTTAAFVVHDTYVPDFDTGNKAAINGTALTNLNWTKTTNTLPVASGAPSDYKVYTFSLGGSPLSTVGVGNAVRIAAVLLDGIPLIFDLSGTNDSLVDTPTSFGTDTGAGGEVRGNYCTWNPLDKSSVVTLSNGNLDAVSTSFGENRTRGTIQIPDTGSWYFEITIGSPAAGYIGIANASAPLTSGGGAKSYGYNEGGAFYTDGSAAEGGAFATFTTDDVIGVKVATNSTITFYKNGTQTGTSKSIDTSYRYFPLLNLYNMAVVANFGQRPWAYPANASGAKALCDTNLPAPLVALPNTVMDVALYTGNGSTQTISGLGFSPDLLWIKGRTGPAAHTLTDAVRGVNAQLMSNLTVAEETVTDAVTALTSTGFSLGANTSGIYPHVNVNANTYVAWTWDAGSSTVTNTQGSISSQVRANASAGFSVVTYSATGSGGATIGHGLNAAPSFIISKLRLFVPGGTNWQCYHASIGNTSSINLNTTGIPNSDIGWWNNTSPTSTVYSVGTYNRNGGDYVTYCFAPVDGYSSFGSYTGNGLTDGPFVYTGFRPKWVMIKCSSIGDAYQHWHMFDTSRSPSNVSKERLRADSSGAEDSFSVIDLLSSGFKIRYTDSYFNQSASTWIYMAFAENPFQYARAR